MQNNGQLDYTFQANRTDSLPEQIWGREGEREVGFMARREVVTSKGEANDKIDGQQAGKKGQN